MTVNGFLLTAIRGESLAAGQGFPANLTSVGMVIPTGNTFLDDAYARQHGEVSPGTIRDGRC
jgi:hypothetical protein